MTSQNLECKKCFWIWNIIGIYHGLKLYPHEEIKLTWKSWFLYLKSCVNYVKLLTHDKTKQGHQSYLEICTINPWMMLRPQNINIW